MALTDITKIRKDIANPIIDANVRPPTTVPLSCFIHKTRASIRAPVATIPCRAASGCNLAIALTDITIIRREIANPIIDAIVRPPTTTPFIFFIHLESSSINAPAPTIPITAPSGSSLAIAATELTIIRKAIAKPIIAVAPPLL